MKFFNNTKLLIEKGTDELIDMKDNFTEKHELFEELMVERNKYVQDLGSSLNGSKRNCFESKSSRVIEQIIK